MRGIGCNEGKRDARTGRNAGVGGRLHLAPGLLLFASVFGACRTPPPEFFPPQPRMGPSPRPEVTREPARAVDHHSVSAIRGQLHVLDGATDRPDLGPVVVYLVPSGPETDRATNGDLPPVVITSRTPEFAPPLAAVSRGQKVVLANEGPLSHGLFSADVGNQKIELPPGTRSAPFSIPPSGPIRFYCALHADETFVVFGGAVRHLAVVEEGDAYTFEPVAPGRYTLTIWSRMVEGPVRDIFADGYSSPVESIWIDPDLVRRPLDPEDSP